MAAGEPMSALLKDLPEAVAGEEGAATEKPEGDPPLDDSAPTAQVAERSAMANVDTAIRDGVGVGKAVRDLFRICVRKYGKN